METQLNTQTTSDLQKWSIDEWLEKNKDQFHPPVCNKLLHNEQLSIMFVGGPNERSDFHMEEGSEFFYQLKGEMTLGTVQQGKAKFVKIRQGEVFLLPSRIPHSPRRGENSLGLVVERRRDKDEKDCLRWYTDDSTCTDVLFEKYFHLTALEKDLVPVVKEFQNSTEAKTKIPGNNVVHNPPFQQDTETSVPDPFSFPQWISDHKERLMKGEVLDLFPNHPDKEFRIRIAGGQSSQTTSFPHETWLYQLEGQITVIIDNQSVTIKENDSMIVPPNKQYTVNRSHGSIGMIITQDPAGNKKNYLISK
jgi:3-hydroxyanthranilate 3,4-dioxygenase